MSARLEAGLVPLSAQVPTLNVFQPSVVQQVSFVVYRVTRRFWVESFDAPLIRF